MIDIKQGKFSFEARQGVDVKLIVLAGWGNYHVRLDIARLHVVDGWQVKRTTLRVWENLTYGIYSPTREIFNRRWTH